MDSWDEVRTAFHVARLGTVSGAAEVLGVHHATVIRHIDALEGRLGVKLFQRHARGYTPTEAGQDLLQVAQATDDQFTQLAGRIKGQGDTLSGELLITAVPGVAQRFTPSLARFHRANPDIRIRFLADTRLFRLEYGEAHVAIRAGNPAEQPDNVVQRFVTMDVALYGSAEYLDEHGTPTSDEDLKSHDFVASYDETSVGRPPAVRWLQSHVPSDRIVISGSQDQMSVMAILEGAALGFLDVEEASRIPGLIQVMPPRPDWEIPLWLVTHVDLHRSPKVQAVLKHLKQEAGL